MADSIELAPDAGDGGRKGTLSRRTMIGAAAWSVPIIAIGTAAPAFASASGLTGASEPWSSWGVTNGSQHCKVKKNGQYKNTYTWEINNTSSSGLGYYGVRFYAPDKSDLYGAYSDLINIYYLPFTTGSVNTHSTSGWSTLAYDSSYSTVTGPGGDTYYPWVTTYSGSYSVTKNSQVHGWNWFGAHKYYWVKIPHDYHFTVTGSTQAAVPRMWVSHEYFAKLNGQLIVNNGSVNSNYPGKTDSYPSNGVSPSSGWRNNAWVKVPLSSGSNSGGCAVIGGGGGPKPGNACSSNKWSQRSAYYSKGTIVSYKRNGQWRNYKAKRSVLFSWEPGVDTQSPLYPWSAGEKCTW